MAVQGQYPSPAALMVSDTNVLEQFQQHCDLFASYQYQGVLQPVFYGTVFSEPESVLTFNNYKNIMSKTRKRNRGKGDDHRHQHHHRYSYANLPHLDTEIIHPNQFKFSKAQSEETFTSGRSSFSYDINSHLLQQNHEIDAILLLQNEKLRAGLEETRRRHCKSMLSVVELQVLIRLEEKEHELANARQRNAELEERAKRLSAENHIWFNVAKTNEAIVSTLKTSLEQILVQNMGQLKEGFEDSVSVMDDAQSCSWPLPLMQKTNCCKVCQENEVSVLLLPCRHLCLCKNCDAKLDACPVCNSAKNASLRILIS